MKLNPDCIKCVMLVLEERLSMEESGKAFFFVGVGMKEAISIVKEKGYDFSDFEIAYSIVQIIERDYIAISGDLSRDNEKGIDIGEILYITPAGHDFLASIQG